MPRGTATIRAIAGVLTASLLVMPVFGCGRAATDQSAKAADQVTTSGPAASTTKTADAKSRTPQKSAIPTNTLVPAVAADALQPPSYEGFERLPSFTYHHVDPKLKNDIAITPAAFEAQLKVLKDEGYHSITARQLADYHSKGTQLPDKPVMITFDDGWKNQYQYAAPLLAKYGFVATYFINPQLIGRGSAYMSREMLVALTESGNDIESHTWTHKKLIRDKGEDQLDFQKRIMRQMTLADTWIEQVVGKKPVALCYPYGYYDLEAVGRAQAAGYRVAFTTEEGVADARPWDAMAMKRFTIGRGQSTALFKDRLHAGVLAARNITPAPGSRVRGITTTVSVDITDVPPEVKGLKLSSGPSLKATTIVKRGGRRYAEARLSKARVGFRQVTLRGEDGAGKPYYASWSLVMGD